MSASDATLASPVAHERHETDGAGFAANRAFVSASNIFRTQDSALRTQDSALKDVVNFAQNAHLYLTQARPRQYKQDSFCVGTTADYRSLKCHRFPLRRARRPRRPRPPLTI